MAKEIRVVHPDTRRVVEGLRDTGYTFVEAVADIVDNSIAAGASHVSVWTAFQPNGDPIVTISDNGCGMDAAGLENAMRYGSAQRESRSSLGRFGLGLKTASTSFCKKLTVISEPRAGGSPLAATWDLEMLAESGEWNLQIGDPDPVDEDIYVQGMDELADLGATSRTGTVVWWDNIDKLLKTKSGAEAKNKSLAMNRTVDALTMHLRTVFQRFLDPKDGRATTIAIGVNGEALRAWDPFCETIGGDRVLDKKLRFEDTPTGSHTAHLRAFILPRKEEFRTDEDRDEALISIDRQGIYLYREDRMIEGPSWLGTGSTETHINNLRVELSFPAQLDEIFGVGIKKSGVHLDQHLIEDIRMMLKPVRREADTRSRRGNAQKAIIGQGLNKGPTEMTIGRLKKDLTVATVTTGTDGSVSLKNNTGVVPLVDSSGRSSGLVKITVDEHASEMNVVRSASLDNGVLWEASLGTNNLIQVSVNAGHDWYRKAYVANAANSPLAQSIEYLFYALAQAEINNTNQAYDEVFEEFRVEVSRNLRRLVRDLPEPDDE